MVVFGIFVFLLKCYIKCFNVIFFLRILIYMVIVVIKEWDIFMFFINRVILV